MKPPYLLFLMIAFAMWIGGASYAASAQQTSAGSPGDTAGERSHDAERAATADDGKGKKEQSPSDEQPAPRHASDNSHSRGRAALTAASRPKQLPNSRKRFIPDNAANLQHPGSGKSAAAAKRGLVQNQAVKKAPLVLSPNVVPATVASLRPSLSNVRHRGPNPPVVGGSANSNRMSTGAINGTHMNRRP